jgi:hypothetical protein
MFIEHDFFQEYSSLRRSEMLFNEIENVLVLERDVKFSQ